MKGRRAKEGRGGRPPARWAFSLGLCLALGVAGCDKKEPPARFDALSGPVEVLRTDFGVPHLYARNLNDLLFAQGYVQAQDRLFQMDLTRRAAEGRLSELYGPSWLSTDKIERVQGFWELGREGAAALEANDPLLWRGVVAYTAGINAFIQDAVAGRHGASFSPQFARIDPAYVPPPWDPSDSIAIGKFWSCNLSCSMETELGLDLFARTVGRTAALDMMRIQPAVDVPIVEGSPLLFPPAPMAPLGALSGGLRSTPWIAAEERASAEGAPTATDPRFLDLLAALVRALAPLEHVGWGSNNWVVSGTRTSGGVPLLANDPHLTLDLPPNFYEMHLATGDGSDPLSVNMVGVTFPGVPGLLPGHNRDAAWGVTTVEADVSDVYYEQSDSAHPDAVLFRGRWVPLVHRPEPIRVRTPGSPVAAAYVNDFTVRIVPQHGPVLSDALPGDILLAVASLVGPRPLVSYRWTGSEVTYEARAFGKISRSDDLESFVASLRDFMVGAQNFVYATTHGDIAYYAPSLYPIRPWDLHADPPYFPLPGTGSCEWDGWLEYDREPHTLNPAAGFVATANNDPIGTTFLDDPLSAPFYLGVIYDNGFRADRITRRIEEGSTGSRRLSFVDMQSIQADIHSERAERLLPYLFQAAADRPDLVESLGLAEPLEILSSWDFQCDAASPAPALFEVWNAHAVDRVYGDEFLEAPPEDQGFAQLIYKTASGLFFEASIRSLLHLLGGAPSASGIDFFDDRRTAPVETWQEDLLRALADTMTQLAACFEDSACSGPNPPGGDPADWAWGRIHRKTFRSAIDFFDDATYDRPAPGGGTGGVWGYPWNGGTDLVMASAAPLMVDGAVADPPYYNDGGSNMRMVVELAPGVLKTQNVIPGGESDDPRSPHYDDQIPLWIQSEAHDVYFWRKDVTAHCRPEESETLPAGFPRGGADPSAGCPGGAGGR